jgi:cyclopropane fatty-acyl-phospholipid synthase-like methyltransferase
MKMQKIEQSYTGEDDIAKLPHFKGNYINFGYWRDILQSTQQQTITVQQRIDASANLYKLVINELSIEKNDAILEVGCGRGNGCILIASEYNDLVEHVYGIDSTREQIEKAKNIHSEFLKNRDNSNVTFIHSDDLSVFPDDSMNKILSVEAAQYFGVLGMQSFAKHVKRILRQNGKLVFTTFFATNEDGYEQSKDLIQTVADGIDQPIPIDTVITIFKNEGFHTIECKSIGSDVFLGFDTWLSQNEPLPTPWSRNVYKAYQSGLIDYYVISMFIK